MKKPNLQKSDSSRLMTIAEASKEYRVFTEAALRSLIQKSKTNDLAMAIVRIGNRVYLDRNRFDQWLESKRESH